MTFSFFFPLGGEEEDFLFFVSFFLAQADEQSKGEEGFMHRTDLLGWVRFVSI